MGTAFAKVLLLLLPLGLTAEAYQGWQQQQQQSGFSRRLLIRPMPGGLNTCRNTNQGPWFMTDDKGKVCPLKEMDFTTGCCSSGEQHYCGLCDKVDSCCESFEHCVSCCMAPDNKPDERRLLTPRMPNIKDSGVWADPFEYCLAICRTHSRSTSHENAYIGARHHCFSKLGKPMLSPPLPAGALDGVTVMLSASGASCSSMCQGKGMACSQSHLHFLNSCDQLREVTNCEAGCEVEGHQPMMPAAVDPGASKQDRPALCLVSKGSPSGDKAFSCDASANNVLRLCPCVKDSGAAAAAATSGAPPAAPEQQQQQQQSPAATAAEGGGAAGGVAADDDGKAPDGAATAHDDAEQQGAAGGDKGKEQEGAAGGPGQQQAGGGGADAGGASSSGAEGADEGVQHPSAAGAAAGGIPQLTEEDKEEGITFIKP